MSNLKALEIPFLKTLRAVGVALLVLGSLLIIGSLLFGVLSYSTLAVFGMGAALYYFPNNDINRIIR